MTDVVDRFLMQASTHPNALAVLDNNKLKITYSQLESMARKIAATLIKSTYQPKVLILLSQGAQAYASMIGTLMAGGYYCPVNVALPEMRKAQIINQFDPDIVLGNSSTLQSISDRNFKIFDIDTLSSEKLFTCETPHELIYVIFTSGSTGTPKGVMIKRNAFSHFIDWAVETYQADQRDYWGQFSNLGFDLSAMDIYTALGSGAVLVPLVSATDRLFPAIAIEKYNLTIWHSVPSAVDLMNQAKQITSKSLKSIRLMSFCGETLLPQHLEKLFKVNPNMTIFNTYGPTETTVFCTWISLNAETFLNACDTTVAIGNPLPGWKIDLVGGEHVDEGEIVISGNYIGTGYWNDIIATKFAYREISVDTSKYRAYYTGDWAERHRNYLFFRHRIDRQVKVRGFRVELGEIDYYIRDFGVSNCCSVFYEKKIYSFLESEEDINEVELQKYLLDRLPLYSQPSKFIIKPRLPRNHNEKVDVKLLITSLEETLKDE